MPELATERPGHVAPGVLLVYAVASVHTVCPGLQGILPAGVLCTCMSVFWRAEVGNPLDFNFFFHCFKGISVEAMSESKMASSELSSGSVEKAAKPLPFKDPNFVVST